LNNAEKSLAPGFVQMKISCFEPLFPHMELIHGQKLQNIFRVETSVNAEIDGFITWQICQLDLPGVLKKTFAYVG
jgi:hypothetical protein